MESMTVQECLQFAADLKMKATQQEKNDRVHDIIRLMRLDRAKNTLVGGQFLKGISGGERKRTSIGFEIVCDP
jgi:ATP-binding cassette subfamily G (WHITE) protein 2